MPGAVVLASLRGAVPRIDQASLAEHGVVDTRARLRRGVEVAGDDPRPGRVKVAGQKAGELSRGPSARALTPVVQVRVEDIEHAAGAPDSEAHPGRHARRAGVFGCWPGFVLGADCVGGS